ncbi:MAG: imidazolonepropionase-like amidohydrolase [Verrucomicrobiales bacterium]|jgi:imidazolonepropionase-like amidohydrolase
MITRFYTFDQSLVCAWLGTAALSLLSFASASETRPAAPQAHPILLLGAHVHTVSGETYEKGKLLIVDGKIANVGGTDLKIDLPADTEIVDVTGKHIYPGLIAANTTIGLIEIDAVRATVDTSEIGDYNSNVRVEVSVNPDSEVIPVTRANGVLTALTVPQGGIISGRSAVMALDGWTWEDMVVKAPAAMHIHWPRLSAGYSQSPGAKSNAASERRKSVEKRIKKLEEFFANARAYTKSDKTPADLRLAAMEPVVAGDLPVFVHADEVAQIQSAVAFAERENIKIVIVGGQDAWRLSKLLKRQKISVILSPQSLPGRRGDAYSANLGAADALSKAGVNFCIAHDGSAASQRNLPYQAAASVPFGLSKDDALKSVTLYAARILGIDDQLGSLETGKDATLIITDGDPLEIPTHTLTAYIKGRKLDLSSRHTRLNKKYREKYESITD